MYTIKYKISTSIILIMIFILSCKNLDEINVNPNGVDPANAHPNLLLSTIITASGQECITLGFGDIAGVMQHTQYDGWSDSHNDYKWSDQDWSANYGVLRNAEEMLQKSRNMRLEFQTGTALIFKAYNFGIIADLWGDAPYSKALLGELGGTNLKPEFDSQRDIYLGILASLDTANTLLSKNPGDYQDINPVQDIMYNGDVKQWQKFANSLALRYFMRISLKEPEIARTGIEKIATQPDLYPLILNAADDAGFAYVGNSTADSWPSNSKFSASRSNFTRIKMCSTLVEKLEALADPRLPVWASKVEIPLVIDPSKPAGFDQIIDGKRVVSKDTADAYLLKTGYPLNTDPNWVGIPPSWSALAQLYNLNPPKEQGEPNPHASQLNGIYEEAAGPLLKARMLSAAEVNFTLAEAALKGWSVNGTASDYYYAGIRASFDAWNLSGSYDDYIAGPGVAFNGTLEQIMEQKWIASWTAAAEAWFDYRRTGLPALTAGPVAKRAELPLRFFYGQNEMLYNPASTNSAIDKLEETAYSSTDGKNSNWSKTWLLQGTDKPW
jgi:Starch-binding associating with outer membrane